MTNKTIKFEFETDIDTAAFIEAFAQNTNQTAKEVINFACKKFVAFAKDEIEKTGIILPKQS